MGYMDEKRKKGHDAVLRNQIIKKKRKKLPAYII